MKPESNKQNDSPIANERWNGQQGFSLVETTVALVVMMVVGLGAASLFVFALGSNNSARDRELSMAVAQQQMERLRNTSFANLDSTVTATGGATKTVTSGGRSYSVVTSIAETVSGVATQKTVTVRVTPSSKSDAGLSAIQRVFGGVTLVTLRSTNQLGPNRGLAARTGIHLKDLTNMPERTDASRNSQGGFSLVELMIAIVISLMIMGAAANLLATSFKVRTRENARTDSIADVQRGLNIMSREIAIGGYGFDPVSNGLVSGDSDGSTIRVRSNLNRYTDGSTTIESESEDVKYLVDTTNGQNYLVRYDQFATGSQATVLANRVDSLGVIYFGVGNTVLDVATTPALVANAIAVRLTVGVNLPAVGVRGASGYQPATTIQLTSDVTLRNKSQNLAAY